MTGVLILVVGPSGVGKDTLLDGVRALYSGDSRFHFLTREITRSTEAGGEDHVGVSVDEFDARRASGAYALYWGAHDLQYGLPHEELAPLERGVSVVANGSRAVLDEARARFDRLAIISIGAAEAVLRARLIARGRESAAAIDNRIARARAFAPSGVDVVDIDNGGDVEEGVARLAEALAKVDGRFRRPYQIADQGQAPDFRRGEGRLDFDNVTFSYGEAAAPLYENFSISIAPGERVGLVGPSGSGKSTFVKLIQRLYDVDHGAIRIDGQAIGQVAQSSLRRAVALAPQDPHLFHRSLAENIAYARPDATMAEIREAARKAHAAEFIDQLPLGYDTLVGERGVKLSGGERQRVAIARAFLADAPIVIFDEATSSLDTITEKYIQEAMAELMEGRTTIIIAHRLSTVRDVDRILVFDKGSIVEQGRHDDLMRRAGGRYRALYDLQGGAA